MLRLLLPSLALAGVLLTASASQAWTPTVAAAQDEGPVWSPDATRIAFTRRTGASTALLVLDRRSGRVRATGTSSNFRLHPSWSPDGRRLAFQARGGVFVLSLGDGGLDELAPGDGSDFSPVWSPNVGTIAFLSTRGNPRRGTGLWAVRPDGTELRWLAARVTGAPLWSSDGSFLLFSRDDSLWVVSADGGGERLVVVAPGVRDASLSPAGDRVAYVRDDRLYVVPLAGARPRPLGRPRHSFGTPAWTPDGQAVVVAHEDGVTVVRDGGERPLVVRRQLGYGAAAVSPGGETVAVPLPREECPGHYGIAIVSLTGAPPTVLTNTCRIVGGRGHDRMAGTSWRGDLLFGGAGNDTILAQDGASDAVSCGAGRDTVYADRSDRVARDCERIRRSR